MCRIAAYCGPPLALRRFLLEPPHGLIQQAHAPRETVSATVNADGVGVGWLAPDGRPAVYRSPLPAWADPNLPALGRSLTSGLWCGSVRSATDPLSNGYANTQPFSDEHRLFLHNGYLEGFATRLRGPIRRWLEPEIEAQIAGTTDSEYLFAVVRQALAHHGDAAAALRAAVARIDGWLHELGGAALLNLVLAGEGGIVALRYAYRHECPSLYFHPAHPGYAGGALVASEAFDGDPGWQGVGPGELLVMEAATHETRLEPL